MEISNLGFNERRFLELYRRFYQTDYPAAEDNNQNAHVQGQKAVYLLMLRQVNVGDYSFTWQHHGPCSDALQNIMRELDKNPQAVKAFYRDYPQNDSVLKKFYSSSFNDQRLFYPEDGERIDAARELFEIKKSDGDKLDEHGDTPIRRWVELLGSLAYISATRLPCADEERVWEELQKAKSKEKYRDASEKGEALRVLRDANLIFGAQT